MRDYLYAFMTECEYPTDAIDVLLSAYDRLSSECPTELSSLIAEYDASYDIDYLGAIDRIHSLAEKCGVNVYTAELLLFLLYTRRLRLYYSEAGLDDSLFLDTVLDLRYKLDECKCVKGVWGSFVGRWFPGFFKLERFALGRLQFEIIPFGLEYEIDGIKLTPDSRILNVHIPRTGTRLDRESTLDAYRRAAQFYRDELGDEIVFSCNSWLLFPRHREILREGANLLAFMNDYNIISSGEYANYSEVWRLFDKSYEGSTADMPADSSLRSAYLDLMERGEKTGWGRGLFVYRLK